MKKLRENKKTFTQACQLAIAGFLVWSFAHTSEAALLKEARVTRVVNDVDLIDGTQSRRDARTNDVMKDDMVLATGHKSRAELQFTDETLARIGANSFFTFSEGTRNMELGKGTMLLKVPKGAGGAKISTQSVTAAITGTTVLLETNPGGQIVMKSDTPLPPTPEADEDLRRQGLGAYLGQGLSSIPPVRQISAVRPTSGQIRVADVTGSVRVMEPGQTQSRPLTSGESIPEGSFVLTQQGGSATLSPAEGVATQISESTSVRVLDVEVTPGISPKVEYDLKEGSILSAIGRDDGQPIDYKIRTPQGVVAARGTVIGTTSTGGQTGVFGGHGLIDFNFLGKKEPIGPGEFKSFTGSGNNIQIGTAIPQNSPQFQQMMEQTIRLVDRAAALGLVRPGLPNDVRGALQRAGIPAPPAPQRSPAPTSGNNGQQSSGEAERQTPPPLTAGNRRNRGEALSVQGDSKSGFSKMVVVEGTMRVYLNDRLGESMLIRPGEMIILNPNANRLPKPVKVDLNRLVGSSRLISGMDENNDPNNPSGTGNDPVLSDNSVRESLNEQKEQIQKGELATTDVAVVKNRLLPKSTVLGDKDENRRLIDNRTNVISSKTGISQYFQKPPIIPGTTTIRNNSEIVGAPPTITTASGTANGSIYPATSRQSIANFAFENGQQPIDSALSTDDSGANQPLNKNAALFKFENLRVSGNPTITQTTDPNTFGSFLPEVIGLISLNDLLVGNGLTVGPNKGLGLPEEVFLVSENANVIINNATLNGLSNDWSFYGRGGDVTIEGSNFILPSGALSFDAKSNILTIGPNNNFDVGHVDFTSLGSVDLSNTNSFTTNSLQVSGRNIILPTVVQSNSVFLTLRYDDTNGSIAPFFLDTSQFPLGTLNSFRGLFSGTDVEISNNFDINGLSQSRLDLGTDEMFTINGVSTSATGANFASVDLIGEQGVSLLTGSTIDATSANGSANTAIGSSLGPISIANSASVLADADSDAGISINSGNSFIDALDTDITATSASGSSAIDLMADSGISIGGISTIDADSSGDFADITLSSNTGLILLDDGSNIIADGDGGSKIFMESGGTFEAGVSGAGGSSISSDSISGSAEINIRAENGIDIFGGTPIAANGDTDAIVNIQNLSSGGIFIDTLTDISTFGSSGTNLINIQNLGGAVSIGDDSSITTFGSGQSIIDIIARNGLVIGDFVSIQSQVIGPADPSTVNITNTTSGNLTIGDDSDVQAFADLGGTGVIHISNNDGPVQLGTPAGNGVQINTDGGDEHHVDITAKGGIAINDNTEINSIGVGNGQSTIIVDNSGSGNVSIGQGASLEAISDTNDTGMDTLVEINNTNGAVIIGDTAGTQTTLTAEVVNNGANLTNPTISIEATNGVQIRSTSDIAAILGAAVNGQGKIYVANNGAGDVVISNGAILAADSGANVGIDPLQEGEIFIENQTGNVGIGDGTGGATLVADRITAQALGGGHLKIYGGSVLSANKQVSLFADSATNGIQFVNNGNPSVVVNSPQTLMRAPVITVDNGMNVFVGTSIITDTLDIQTNTKNFGVIGQGDISFNGATVPNTNGAGTGNGGVGNFNVSNF